MTRKTGLLAALAVLAATPFAPPCHAQAPGLAPPPRPVPADAAAFNPLPDLPQPPDQPPSLTAPAPAGLYESAPLPGPYFEGDVLLNPPQLAQPGWFADVDVLLAKGHVKNKLTNASIPGGAPDVVRLGSAPLDWTAAPRFEVGRNLASGFGAFALSFRFLTTEGTGLTQGMDAPAALRSRLDLDVVDLDYISHEISLWPKWDMTWRLGGRFGYAYFDSRADEPFDAAAAGSGVFEQRVSNRFWGFGPHTGVEVDRLVNGTGLSFFASGDFWIDLGRIQQTFNEATTTPGPDGLSVTETTVASGNQAVPVLNLQAGLRWRPPEYPNWELFLGYEYEYWWNVGRFSSPPDSRGELSDQGALLRAAINF